MAQIKKTHGILLRRFYGYYCVRALTFLLHVMCSNEFIIGRNGNCMQACGEVDAVHVWPCFVHRH